MSEKENQQVLLNAMVLRRGIDARERAIKAQFTECSRADLQRADREQSLRRQIKRLQQAGIEHGTEAAAAERRAMAMGRQVKELVEQTERLTAERATAVDSLNLTRAAHAEAKEEWHTLLGRHEQKQAEADTRIKDLTERLTASMVNNAGKDSELKHIADTLDRERLDRLQHDRLHAAVTAQLEEAQGQLVSVRRGLVAAKEVAVSQDQALLNARQEASSTREARTKWEALLLEAKERENDLREHLSRSTALFANEHVRLLECGQEIASLRQQALEQEASVLAQRGQVNRLLAERSALLQRALVLTQIADEPLSGREEDTVTQNSSSEVGSSKKRWERATAFVTKEVRAKKDKQNKQKRARLLWGKATKKAKELVKRTGAKNEAKNQPEKDANEGKEVENSSDKPKNRVVRRSSITEDHLSNSGGFARHSGRIELTRNPSKVTYSSSSSPDSALSSGLYISLASAEDDEENEALDMELIDARLRNGEEGGEESEGVQQLEEEHEQQGENLEKEEPQEDDDDADGRSEDKKVYQQVPGSGGCPPQLRGTKGGNQSAERRVVNRQIVSGRSTVGRSGEVGDSGSSRDRPRQNKGDDDKGHVHRGTEDIWGKAVLAAQLVDAHSQQKQQQQLLQLQALQALYSQLQQAEAEGTGIKNRDTRSGEGTKQISSGTLTVHARRCVACAAKESWHRVAGTGISKACHGKFPTPFLLGSGAPRGKVSEVSKSKVSSNSNNNNNNNGGIKRGHQTGGSKVLPCNPYDPFPQQQREYMTKPLLEACHLNDAFRRARATALGAAARAAATATHEQEKNRQRKARPLNGPARGNAAASGQSSGGPNASQ